MGVNNFWGGIRFSLQKGFITDRNTPQFHQLSDWLVADGPAGEKGVEVLG
jgi:hypothetical protein